MCIDVKVRTKNLKHGFQKVSLSEATTQGKIAKLRENKHWKGIFSTGRQ